LRNTPNRSSFPSKRPSLGEVLAPARPSAIARPID
jgi:hypothetical protein